MLHAGNQNCRVPILILRNPAGAGHQNEPILKQNQMLDRCSGRTVEGLGRSSHSGGGVAPPQAVTIDEDDPPQNLRIIDARSAMALQKLRLQTRRLGIRKSEKVAQLGPVTPEASNKTATP